MPGWFYHARLVLPCQTGSTWPDWFYLARLVLPGMMDPGMMDPGMMIPGMMIPGILDLRTLVFHDQLHFSLGEARAVTSCTLKIG